MLEKVRKQARSANGEKAPLRRFGCACVPLPRHPFQGASMTRFKRVLSTGCVLVFVLAWWLIAPDNCASKAQAQAQILPSISFGYIGTGIGGIGGFGGFGGFGGGFGGFGGGFGSFGGGLGGFGGFPGGFGGGLGGFGGFPGGFGGGFGGFGGGLGGFAGGGLIGTVLITGGNAANILPSIQFGYIGNLSSIGGGLGGFGGLAGFGGFGGGFGG
ncbi:MAG TPA: hypothetical protein VNK04_24530, partial [Gemmataceae bacterium]|nr:hypothetical protein [Gemmataceae bacterium]